MTRALPLIVLILAGAAWGATQPLAKTAVSEGYRHFGILFWQMCIGAVITLPLALMTGQFIDPRGPWGAPDAAIVATALLHAGAYTSYVWLVGRAGPVFTVQVSYFVTLFGVTWAMLFLGESYSSYFWAALAVMLAGLALVQPRPKAVLVPPAQPGQTGEI